MVVVTVAVGCGGVVVGGVVVASEVVWWSRWRCRWGAVALQLNRESEREGQMGREESDLII